ncbi:hypothetical protein Lal_00018202 [Lupinus albus]|nr:hypothetical protein Lal_00018202 [Lupinus albus]
MKNLNLATSIDKFNTTTRVFLSNQIKVDDAILMGECLEQNMMTIKNVLRLFELTSGLKVNFTKSNLIGTNVLMYDIRTLSITLDCMISEQTFSYSGITLSLDHRRIEMWKSILERFQSRLLSWEKAHISFGDQIH